MENPSLKALHVTETKQFVTPLEVLRVNLYFFVFYVQRGNLDLISSRWSGGKSQCKTQLDLETLPSVRAGLGFGALCMWLRKEVTYALVTGFSLLVCAA